MQQFYRRWEHAIWRSLLIAGLVLLASNQPMPSRASHHPSTPVEVAGQGELVIHDEFYYAQYEYYDDIGAPALWARGLTGIDPARPITVAVIDTGVADHPDLTDNLVAGYNFVENEPTTAWQDTSLESHGTKIAGIIAARMNNTTTHDLYLGVVGIGGGNVLSATPGLQIMPLRIAADTRGITRGQLCLRSARAIRHAIEHGALVINMSYNSGGCAEEEAAVAEAYAAGLVMIAGAGNDNQEEPIYPAAYGSTLEPDLVIAVAGVYPSGRKADASNYGSWVDVSAPFHAVSLTKDDGYVIEGYALDAGTSFSAAYVSGLVGVLLSNYGWSRQEVLATLRRTADPIDAQNPNMAGKLGAGRINLDRASDTEHRLFLPTIKG